MGLFFVVAFALAMYVVAPLAAAWAIWSLLGIRRSDMRLLLTIACVAFIADYWQTERRNSQLPLPSTREQANAVAATKP